MKYTLTIGALVLLLILYLVLRKRGGDENIANS